MNILFFKLQILSYLLMEDLEEEKTNFIFHGIGVAVIKPILNCFQIVMLIIINVLKAVQILLD